MAASPFKDYGRVVDLSGNDVVVRNIMTAANPGGSGFKQLFGNGAVPLSTTSTSFTLSTANMLTGIVVVNSAGSTVTLDTAALMVAGVNAASAGVNVGDIVGVEISANTGTVTVQAGSGGTFDTNVTAGAKVIPIAGAKTVFVRFTNVTPGSEAYVIYM